MIFYLIDNIIFALTLTIIIFLITKLPIKIDIRKKRLVTRIEKQLSANFNYFRKKQAPKIDDYVKKLIAGSGMNIKLSIIYVLSLAFSIVGASIGYKLLSPLLILLLTIVLFFIPIFTLYLISAYQNAKSYKTTFKVLHAAEKASQLTNSPLIVFSKIMPYLSYRDKEQFNGFLKNFEANKPYLNLFYDLEKNLSNNFLKELVTYGRETSNGINYNHAINLILDGYNTTYELMEERKRKINGMVYLLYTLAIAFIGFSIFITNNYILELQSTPVIQLFFKSTIIAVILAVILASTALINANQH